jgi:hypothetical protein
MTEEGRYWEGATWVYRANIVNDGVNAGNHVYLVSPGAGNEMEILYGSLLNGDATNRSALARIEDDEGNILAEILLAFTLNAGIRASFPAVDEAAATGMGLAAGSRLILSGAMQARFQISSVAVSEDTAFAIVCRIRGARPTVTLTSPTGATETVDKDQVF